MIQRVKCFIPLMLFVIACASSQDSVTVEKFQNYSDQPRVVKVYSSQKPQKSVNGICLISENEQFLFDTPCRGLVFQLLDKNGIKVGETQTSESGVFRIQAHPKQRYQLTLNSEKFEIVAKEIEVFAGAELLVRVQRIK